MGSEYRQYRDGCTHHVYCKAVDGNIIFYSVQDCIYYLSLYYLLAKRYGIRTLAFDIMPNHIHSNELAPSKEQFLLFHCRLNSEFSQGYNEWHGRSGQLFMSPFGFAPKTVGKRIRENIAYIINNPVAGKLTKTIQGYKWNLVAYRDSDHPFSEKNQLNRSSHRFRRSIDLLKHYHSKGSPLDYNRQNTLFKGLSSKERAQLIDRIISLYNCIDYKAVSRYYQGSFENTLMVISASSGSEHDIPEDFEDYGFYTVMLNECTKRGIDLKTCNFENWPAIREMN